MDNTSGIGFPGDQQVWVRDVLHGVGAFPCKMQHLRTVVDDNGEVELMANGAWAKFTPVYDGQTSESVVVKLGDVYIVAAPGTPFPTAGGTLPASQVKTQDKLRVVDKVLAGIIEDSVSIPGEDAGIVLGALLGFGSRHVLDGKVVKLIVNPKGTAIVVSALLSVLDGDAEVNDVSVSVNIDDRGEAFDCIEAKLSESLIAYLAGYVSYRRGFHGSEALKMRVLDTSEVFRRGVLEGLRCTQDDMFTGELALRAQDLAVDIAGMYTSIGKFVGVYAEEEGTNVVAPQRLIESESSGNRYAALDTVEINSAEVVGGFWWLRPVDEENTEVSVSGVLFNTKQT